jgi:hypothetical protein
MESEKYPVSETLKILEGKTIYKTEKWWSAVLLLDSFGRKQIATYLWQKSGDQWKRRQKFVIQNNEEWGKIRTLIEELLPKL